MINKILFFCVINVSMWIPLAAVADVDFDIRGLDLALEANVKVYLNSIPEHERWLNFHFQSRVTEKVSEALQALGYYEPIIMFMIKDRTSKTDATVVLDINAGDPILIGDVDVELIGEASADPVFTKLLETAPKEGDVLNQGQYGALKSSITSLAIRRGYFAAKYTLARLEVAPGLRKAYIRLHFNSGVRYHFGEVIYNNSQINDLRLDSLLTFQEGDPYSINKLGMFNQDLSNTGWFSSVLVEAGIDDMHDNHVPISVSLSPAPRNLLETGLGYSRDIGTRVKIGWAKPWINNLGHSFNTELYISKPKQTIESTYKIPLENVQLEYYQVQLGFKKFDNKDKSSRELTTSVSRHWKYNTGWQHSVYIRWLYSAYTKANALHISNLMLPGINFSRVRSLGGAMPSWGDKQSITFEVANSLWGTHIKFYRVIGQTAWIRSKNDNSRRIARLNVGCVFTDKFNSVPPSLIFFVGGDNSIRGYNYESISPRDVYSNRVGGSYMATGTLEYQYRITGNWWAAMFIDAGDAWRDRNPSWKTSGGVGVRWESPIGPVRLDIAHGIENTMDTFKFYFSLGPEL
ncbi:autotransporter assembly complex protein TamA [Candidatus Enterovibrio escicola]|uniref:autotransporter assembly complex protein TamA n=2 Tax=Candidatus Enterovibrio escicola TaxID=1927127 RepID=UPI001237C788|nr:autotransporter assembly complex family protein [Candidatus Enterovibrio escacola]